MQLVSAVAIRRMNSIRIPIRRTCPSQTNAITRMTRQAAISGNLSGLTKDLEGPPPITTIANSLGPHIPYDHTIPSTHTDI